VLFEHTAVVTRNLSVNLFARKTEMVAPDHALPGRDLPIGGLGRHLVLGTPITPPFPEGTEHAVFGMECFWGADRPL
jgi:peptide-methionine (S)-S-oxide reductase